MFRNGASATDHSAVGNVARHGKIHPVLPLPPGVPTEEIDGKPASTRKISQRDWEEIRKIRPGQEATLGFKTQLKLCGSRVREKN